MLRHSVRRTLSSLSLVVLLGAAPATAQSFTSLPPQSSRPVAERLLSWVSEAWAGLENLAVQVFAQEKDGEGTGAGSPDGSTTSGAPDPTDPSNPDNGAWIDPNG
ncbi:MAG TPA: hypothetical protein VMW27_25560 [Thermoanaerobaculia bacterium]|nr:hypothetical protein [Thermoanaerobaculia bacterium]